jgi:eukaryotic-like serine/threonine-protein kinase
MGLCSECGAELPIDAPHGLCAKCLFSAALPQAGEATNKPSPLGEEPLDFTRHFGDYQLISEIARGGMGVVYKARQKSLKRSVALKMILAGPFASRVFVQRFKTEAEAAANLDHPNIVPIYEIGEHEGQHYFTMKLVEGGNLAGYLSDKLLPVSKSVQLMMKIARAVHYAHQRGVLHRDIKPGNILLDEHGEPYVTDFGLAKLLHEHSDLTQSEAVIGTASYMSPEQARGQLKTLSTAADTYSLGAVFYEMLAGRPPFKGENTFKLLAYISDREPQPPSTFNSTIDRDLETICLKCLEKDPQRRYPSAESFAADLQRWSNHEPIEARAATSWERTRKWVRRRPVAATVLAAVALLFLAISAILVISVVRISAARNDLRRNLYVSQTSVAAQSFWEGNVGHTRHLLDNQRPRPGEDDLRGFEWRYLWGISRSNEVFTFPPVPTEVWALSFSGDGRFLAAGTSASDGSVRLYDYAGRKEIIDLKPSGVGQLVDSIAFSPDNREMACTYRLTRQLRIWELASHRVRLEITNFTQWLNAVAYSPDGSSLVAVTGQSYGRNLPGEASIYSSKTGEKLVTLDGPASWLMRVEWSPDGKTIVASGGQGTALLWDAATRDVTKLRAHRGDVFGLAISPDGKVLATADTEGLIRLWDLNTKSEILSISGHTKPIYTLAFSSNGLLALKLWDARTLKALNTFRGHSGRVTKVDFVPDGSSLVSASVDGTVRVWDTAQRTSPPLLTSHGTLMTAVQADFTCDSRYICILTNTPGLPLSAASVAIWDAASRASITSFSGDSFTLSFDGKWLSSRGQQEITLFQVGTFKELKRFQSARMFSPPSAYDDAKHLVGISPDGLWLAGGFRSNRVEVWDTQRGGATSTSFAVGTASRAPSVLFSLDSSILLTLGAGDNRINLWKAGTWEHVGTFDRFDFRVALSPDGRTVASTISETLCLWDLPTRRKIREISGDAGTIWAVAFSPDGKTLAAGTHEGSVKFWNMATLQEITTLQTHLSIVSSIAFSPDGACLITASIDDSVKLWPAPSFLETDAVRATPTM